MHYNALLTIIKSQGYVHRYEDGLLLIGTEDMYGFMTLVCTVNPAGKVGGVIFYQKTDDQALLSLIKMFVTTPKSERF